MRLIMNKSREIEDIVLYLPIKQIYFDQIVARTKTAEHREIKEGLTANKYLIKDDLTGYKLNPEAVDDLEGTFFIDDYNDGKFPFLPREYKYLSLAVGYAKERDTAIVEVTGFSFTPHMIRNDREGIPRYAFWTINFHLGKVIELHRK